MAIAYYKNNDWQELALLSGGIGSNVAQTLKTDTFSASVASGGTATVTGFTTTITPTSSTAKILVVVSASIAISRTAETMSIILTRNGSVLSTAIGDAAASRTRVTSSQYSGGDYSVQSITSFFLDSPATTSATTYGIDLHSQGGITLTMYLNRSHTDLNNARWVRATSTITAIEVAP